MVSQIRSDLIWPSENCSVFLGISSILLSPTYKYCLVDLKGNVWTIGAGASDKRKEKCKNRCNNEAASGIKMLRLVANL